MIKDVRHLITYIYIMRHTIKRIIICWMVRHIPRKYTCNTNMFQGVKTQYTDNILLLVAIRYAKLVPHAWFVFIINAISRLNYVFIAGML